MSVPSTLSEEGSPRVGAVLRVGAVVAVVGLCVQGVLLGGAALLGSPAGGWLRMGLEQLGGA
ncbi:MAG: hypothetical protein AB1505_37170, partial [Candidatus Latescibacterota bacterium]